jgi:hypothetical protein
MLIKSLNTYGPAAVLLAAGLFVNGFFIWRDWQREGRQQKQIDELHRSHREIVVPLLTECKEMMGSCKEVIAQNSQVIMSVFRARSQ